MENYSNNLLQNLETDNIKKIIQFLREKNCDYIEDILEDYLDLFAIDFDIFQTKFYNLNKKYNNSFLKLASENMNLLEEFYN